MNAIVVPDEDLKRLEKRFGPAVRYMGPWNSDGIFGYCSVPLAAVEKAADTLNDPPVSESLQQLKQTPDPTLPFIEMLQNFGFTLIERIVAAEQEHFLMGHPACYEGLRERSVSLHLLH